jgi:hypothetical protein
MTTRRHILLFGIVILCATPVGGCRVPSGDPNAGSLEQIPPGAVNSKTENEPIRGDPNEQAEAPDAGKAESWELQYTELLAVHRTYFTVFLQVLSIYLAIMGACLKIVSDFITKMKRDPEKASKTVLILLILFSFGVSGLFFAGLVYGLRDATERRLQIEHVGDILEIDHIRVNILEQVIWIMIIGTALIGIAWIVMFVRALTACAQQRAVRASTPSLGRRTP